LEFLVDWIAVDLIVDIVVDVAVDVVVVVVVDLIWVRLGRDLCGYFLV
jgi:hypothetical protein